MAYLLSLKNIQVIAKARVPIIKFVEKKSGIAFDIRFDIHISSLLDALNVYLLIVWTAAESLPFIKLIDQL